MRLFIIIFLLSSYISFGRNIINDLKLLDNGDTVMTSRYESRISFGINHGTSFLFNNGNILLPQDPYFPANYDNELKEYKPDYGYGFRCGLFFEYRLSDIIGIAIDLSPLYYKDLGFSLINNGSNENSKKIISKSFYVSFNPKLIVYFDHFELSIGMNYNRLLKSNAFLRTNFSNTSNIEIEKQIHFSPLINTTGFLFTVQYDLVTALVSNEMRLKASPFLTYSYIPNFFETYSTSSANNSIEIGIRLSLGFDRIKTDTLKFNGFQRNIDNIEKGMQLAVKQNNIRTKDIKEIDVDLHEPDFAESPPLDRINIEFSMKEYLEYLVELVKNGSANKIEIIAKISEKEKRSLIIRKVKAIIRFLESKGIKSNSIILTEDKDSRLEKSKIEINIVN